MKTSSPRLSWYFDSGSAMDGWMDINVTKSKSSCTYREREIDNEMHSIGNYYSIRISIWGWCCLLSAAVIVVPLKSLHNFHGFVFPESKHLTNHTHTHTHCDFVIHDIVQVIANHTGWKWYQHQTKQRHIYLYMCMEQFFSLCFFIFCVKVKLTACQPVLHAQSVAIVNEGKRHCDGWVFYDSEEKQRSTIGLFTNLWRRTHRVFAVEWV